MNGLGAGQEVVVVASARATSDDNGNGRWLQLLLRQVHVLVNAAEEAVELWVRLQEVTSAAAGIWKGGGGGGGKKESAIHGSTR